MPNPDPAKHTPTEAERDERVRIDTDLSPEEALALVLKVDPEGEPAKQQPNAGTEQPAVAPSAPYEGRML